MRLWHQLKLCPVTRLLLAGGLLLALWSGLVRSAYLLANPHLQPLLTHGDGLLALLWGGRFDLAAAAGLTLLLLLCWLPLLLAGRLTAFWLRLGWWLAALWLLLATHANCLYFIETGRHVTFELFTSRELETGLLLTALLNYPRHALLLLLLLAVMSALCWRWPLPRRWPRPAARVWLWLLLFLLPLQVTALRGGWSDAPQTPMSAYKWGQPAQAALAWNPAFAMSYYLAKGPQQALQQLPPALDLPPPAAMAERPVHKRARVVVVLLESWSAVDSRGYGGPVDATPQFDRLRAQGLSTRMMYANGYRTHEGVFAVMCSFANPLGGGVAGTQLQALDYRCLPEVLRQQGWQTHFVQGSGKGVVGDFAQSLGFEHSHGKEDYPFEGHRNKWGYMDDEIYRYALQQLEASDGPLLMAINTGTTHDQILPAGQDYRFGSKNRDARRRSVLHHADAALGRFVQALWQQSKGPTLLVLVADHTACPPMGGLACEAIPFAMLANDASLQPRQLAVTASQRDLAPTIIDWLGGQVPWFSGQSLLAAAAPGIADFSRGQQVSLLYGRQLITLDSRKGRLQSCSRLSANGLAMAVEPCSGAGWQSLARSAWGYIRYSQQLLFAGRTVDYRPVAFSPAMRLAEVP